MIVRNEATNDKYIRLLLSDTNYSVHRDGVVVTRITKTGKVSVKNQWRECNTIRNGYRTLRYKGKELRISRIVYMKFGNIRLRPEMLVGHLDGNTLNDFHTNLVATNMASINLDRFKRKPAVMGNTKLTWEKVEEIRLHHQYGGLSYKKISEMYNISKGHISEIINGKIWIKGKHYAFSKNVEPYVTGKLSIPAGPQTLKREFEGFVPGDTEIIEADHCGGQTTIHKRTKVTT